jgi:hypothetical protein
MSDVQHISLYPKIDIYTNILDTKLIIEKIKNLPDSVWEEWSTFGHYFTIYGVLVNEKILPDSINFSNIIETDPAKKEIAELIEKAFFNTTLEYIKRNSMSFDNWHHAAFSVCKYITLGGNSEKLAMGYHTDYTQEIAEQPGYKHGITVTMYLNDDYEGGEICFKIMNGDINDKIEHDPMAGEILIFPSGQPYYHAVKKITKGEKYFIRSFWYFKYDGSEEWLKNQEFYGKEEWAKMEKKRVSVDCYKYLKYDYEEKA